MGERTIKEQMFFMNFTPEKAGVWLASKGIQRMKVRLREMFDARI